ncbi:MAG: MAPEG family protein [Bermanella sp.]
MTIQPSSELFYLALCAGLTGILWMPYIVNRIVELGLWTALRNPNPDQPPKAKWAHRLMCAHNNAVENLVVFGVLVLAVQVSGMNSESTALAALVFFYTRVAHVTIYTLGIPLLRTISFFIGFICQGVLLMSLVG